MTTRKFMSTSLAFAVLAGGASAAPLDLPGDHYLCYRARLARVPAQSVAVPLVPSLSVLEENRKHYYQLTKPTTLCTPATKTHDGTVFAPTHPDIHEVGIEVTQINSPRAPRFSGEHPTLDQFATLRLRGTHRALFLMPSLKADLGQMKRCSNDADCAQPAPARQCNLGTHSCLPNPLPTLGTPPAPGSGVDRFLCYGAVNYGHDVAPTPVTIADQFGSADYNAFRPSRLCNPVDMNAGGIEDPSRHLVCYRLRRTSAGPRFAAHTVSTKSAELGSLFLEVREPYQLCVPALRDVLTTTTTTTTVTVTTTTEPGPALDFAIAAGTTECGTAEDAAAGGGSVFKSLKCGGLDIGGGTSTVPEGPIPDGGTNRFLITGCSGDECTVGPSHGPGTTFDCSDTGCAFGAPLAIRNGSLSTCVVNRFAAPVTGTFNQVTGESTLNVQLASHVFATFNDAAPCPVCRVNFGGPGCVGTPAAPCTGRCDRGVNKGQRCVTTNSHGLSGDCSPEDPDDNTLDLATLSVDLTPLVTGTASKSAADGNLCPGQAQAGCFNRPDCQLITEHGAPASGPLLPAGTVQPMTLGSVFCIPATGSALIDSAASLPGPGAASLTGTATIVP
jgi:hypothetical protein